MNIPIDEQRDAAVDGGDELRDELRWQLRALRRDEAPARELWPAIAARLQPASVVPSTPGRRWPVPLAAAATLVIALGFAGLWRGQDSPGFSPSANAASTLVQREAAGMARQYDAALSEVAIAAPGPDLQVTLNKLDSSLGLIHAALARDPDSQLLLKQLRRTYAHRLALAQRAAYS